MAGLAHDVLIQALRDDAKLLPLLMLRLTGRRLPGKLRSVDSAVRFTRAAEVRPDVVYRRGRAWLLCEVQNKPDKKKAGSWTLAVAALHLETRQMGDSVILTASAAVARWAQKVACVVGSAGTALRLSPVVLLLDRRRARELLDPSRPELALCAAWAMQGRHGKDAVQIVERALELTDSLPPPLRDAQWRAILDVLSDRMRSRLYEAAMHPDRVPESPATRKLRLLLQSLGEKRGRAEGRTEGLAAGKRDTLLMILAERGMNVSAAERARIQACSEITELDTWLKRALTAESAAQVLGPKPVAKALSKRRPAPRRPVRAAKNGAHSSNS